MFLDLLVGFNSMVKSIVFYFYDDECFSSTPHLNLQCLQQNKDSSIRQSKAETKPLAQNIVPNAFSKLRHVYPILCIVFWQIFWKIPNLGTEYNLESSQNHGQSEFLKVTSFKSLISWSLFTQTFHCIRIFHQRLNQVKLLWSSVSSLRGFFETVSREP